jgi:hypothetical protein
MSLQSGTAAYFTDQMNQRLHREKNKALHGDAVNRARERNRVRPAWRTT